MNIQRYLEQINDNIGNNTRRIDYNVFSHLTSPATLKNTVFLNNLQNKEWDFYTFEDYGLITYDLMHNLYYKDQTLGHKSIVVRIKNQINTEQISTAFELASPSGKDLFNEFLAISHIYEAHPDRLSYITYIHKKEKLIYSFVSNPNNPSRGQLTRHPEFPKYMEHLQQAFYALEPLDKTIEDIFTQPNSQDQIIKLLTDLGIDPLAYIYEDINKQEIKRIQMGYKRAQENYDYHLNSLKKAQEDMKHHKDQAAQLPELQDLPNKLMKELHMFPQIEYVRTAKYNDTFGLVFSIVTDMQIDTELVTRRVIGSRRTEKEFQFLKDIASKEISVKFVGDIFVSQNDIKYFSEDIPLPTNHYYNPHLHKHNCFGDNKANIRNSYQQFKMVPLALSLIRTIGNFNLLDSVVFNYFLDEHFRNGTISVFVPQANEFMSYSQYLINYKSETRQTDSAWSSPDSSIPL